MSSSPADNEPPLDELFALGIFDNVHPSRVLYPQLAADRLFTSNEDDTTTDDVTQQKPGTHDSEADNQSHVSYPQLAADLLFTSDEDDTTTDNAAQHDSEAYALQNITVSSGVSRSPQKSPQHKAMSSAASDNGRNGTPNNNAINQNSQQRPYSATRRSLSPSLLERPQKRVSSSPAATGVAPSLQESPQLGVSSLSTTISATGRNTTPTQQQEASYYKAPRWDKNTLYRQRKDPGTNNAGAARQKRANQNESPANISDDNDTMMRDAAPASSSSATQNKKKLPATFIKSEDYTELLPSSSPAYTKQRHFVAGHSLDQKSRVRSLDGAAAQPPIARPDAIVISSDDDDASSDNNLDNGANIVAVNAQFVVAEDEDEDVFNTKLGLQTNLRALPSNTRNIHDRVEAILSKRRSYLLACDLKALYYLHDLKESHNFLPHILLEFFNVRDGSHMVAGYHSFAVSTNVDLPRNHIGLITDVYNQIMGIWANRTNPDIIQLFGDYLFPQNAAVEFDENSIQWIIYDKFIAHFILEQFTYEKVQSMANVGNLLELVVSFQNIIHLLINTINKSVPITNVASQLSTITVDNQVSLIRNMVNYFIQFVHNTYPLPRAYTPRTPSNPYRATDNFGIMYPPNARKAPEDDIADYSLNCFFSDDTSLSTYDTSPEEISDFTLKSRKLIKNVERSMTLNFIQYPQQYTEPTLEYKPPDADEHAVFIDLVQTQDNNNDISKRAREWEFAYNYYSRTQFRIITRNIANNTMVPLYNKLCYNIENNVFVFNCVIPVKLKQFNSEVFVVTRTFDGSLRMLLEKTKEPENQSFRNMVCFALMRDLSTALFNMEQRGFTYYNLSIDNVVYEYDHNGCLRFYINDVINIYPLTMTFREDMFQQPRPPVQRTSYPTNHMFAIQERVIYSILMLTLHVYEGAQNTNIYKHMLDAPPEYKVYYDKPINDMLNTLKRASQTFQLFTFLQRRFMSILNPVLADWLRDFHIHANDIEISNFMNSIDVYKPYYPGLWLV